MPDVTAVTFLRAQCRIMRAVNEVAKALRAARAVWDDATREGGAACGTDVAEQAYTTMQAALFAELGAHIEAQTDGQ
jgi:hypothetical protein